MPEHDTLPDDLRERLDAARERLHVSIEWHPAGGPKAHGRAFGFWIVTAGPEGWQHRPKREYRYGQAPETHEVGPCVAEGPDLAHVLTLALDTAEAW